MGMIQKAVQAVAARIGLQLNPLSENRSAWWPIIRDWYPGAWQNNDEMTVDTPLTSAAIYACITLTANDVGKMRPKLVERVGGIGKVWKETSSPAFSPFLRKPNRYQNHIQFKQWWITSKQISGNAYGLKDRDDRGVVRAVYILDPTKVKPLVTPSGSVYYQLSPDNLSGLTEPTVTVPASEIIHDRTNCLFHPLVGVSPLYACALAALQGTRIQEQSSTFFGNGARPSGILTAPGPISEETATRLKQVWEQKFTGQNAGRVAVLGDGLKYEQMTMSAVDSQVVQQLNWGVENICMAFHVPPWKIGHGTMPAFANGEILNQSYYDECLGILIEEFELAFDEGLGIGEGVIIEGRELGVELNTKTLLRMDTKTLHEVLRADVSGSLSTLNEARAELDLPPIEGGDDIYMQQQNYSLEALRKRDAQADPFGTNTPAPPAPPAANDSEEEPTAEQALSLLFLKAPENLAHV